MSWEDILKVDNVDFYGYYEKDKDGNKILSKPTSKAWFDGRETFVNLTKVKGLEDFIESDLHETIHQVTLSEIDNEIQQFLTEETKYLHNSPELYSVRNGTVRPKKQLYDSLKKEIGEKLASHIAFTEIVTLLQSDTTNLDGYDTDSLNREDLYLGYLPQFQNEMRRQYYKWIYRNMIVGASNALNTEKKWGQITTDRDRDRHQRLKIRFCDEIGQMAARVLVETLEINQNWDKTIDFKDGKTETIGQAKERLKKSWGEILKNIQISGQRTTSKDIVAPDDNDDCCEMLKDFVGRATDFEPDNPFGDGMVGVPTFYDTSGYVPDDDFLEMIYEWKEETTGKREFFYDIMELLNKTGDPVKEWERLKGIYQEAVKYVLFYNDSCDKIVTTLDKWSDRNFVGWQFYEEWVYPYTTSMNSVTPKQATDRDYEKYMDSYRKLWMALLQNNCADILIQKPWMRMANQG
jgi:hypothetical protein